MRIRAVREGGQWFVEERDSDGSFIGVTGAWSKKEWAVEAANSLRRQRRDKALSEFLRKSEERRNAKLEERSQYTEIES